MRGAISQQRQEFQGLLRYRSGSLPHHPLGHTNTLLFPNLLNADRTNSNQHEIKAEILPQNSMPHAKKEPLCPHSLTAQNLSRIRQTSTTSSSNTENQRIVYLSIYSQDLRELSGRDRIAMARLMAVHSDFALLFRNLARTHPNIFSLSTFKNFSAPLNLMR